MIDSGNLWKTIISPSFLRTMGYTRKDLRPVPGLTKLGTAKKGADLRILGQLKHTVLLQFAHHGTSFRLRPVVVEGLSMDMNISGPFLKANRIDQIHTKDSLRIQGKLIPLVSPKTERPRRSRAATLLLDPAEENLLLPPGTVSTVMTRFAGGEERQGDGIVCGLKAFDEHYGIHTWRNTLTKVEADGRVAVQILNSYHKPVKIPHGEEMGTFRSTRTSHGLISPPEDGDMDRRVLIIEAPTISAVTPQPVSDPEGAKTASKWTNQEKREWVRKEFCLDESPCLPTEDDKRQATLLLTRYFDVFSVDGEFGATDIIKHRIDTGDAAPIRLRNRPLNPVLEEDLNKQLDRWLKHRVIEPAESPWNFALVAAPKKGGKIRWCVDFRRLNLVTRKDAFPLPSIEDNLARLSRSKVFSGIDGCGAFHVVEVDAKDREKTAFSTPRGQFQFVRMPFGLANAPASYSRLVQKVLEGIPLGIALPYLDDTAIHTSTLPEHYKALAKVLEAHRAAGLKLQPSKCQLFRDQIAYLGHLVSPQGIQTLPSHTKAIEEWPMPTTKPQARSFIGKLSYYRKYVPNFSALAKPWTSIMNKNSTMDDRIPLTLDTEMKESFHALRDKLLNAPILAYPRFSSDEPFILDTDWSGDHMAIGAVLSQKQDGLERVIAYGSKKLNSGQASYSAHKGELFAIIYFLKHFKYYLLYRPFILRTDHHALKWIYTMEQPVAMTARWLETLANFDFKVIHRPGTQHGNADALSRIDHGEPPDEETSEDEATGVSLFHLWTQRVWDRNELQALQKEDPVLKIIRHLKITGRALEPLVEKGMDEQYRTYKMLMKELFIDEDGILCRGARHDIDQGGLANRRSRRVCLPRELWDHVIGIQHEVGGHMGRDNTLDRVHQVAYFPNMKTEVADYIRSCHKCQQKQKLPTAQRHTMVSQNAGYPFQRISVDFVGPLPTSITGNTYILTVKDVFSKWLEAFPIPAQTAEIAANIMHKEVFCRFGLPEVIHSDNGRQFVSRLWAIVGDKMGIKITHTPTYNAKSNPVERAHRDLNGMLKSLSAGEPANWEEYLPAALLAMRTCVNASTKFAPYRLLFGRDANTPLDLIFGGPPEPIPGKRGRGRPRKEPHHVTWANALKEKVQRAFEFARANTADAVIRRRRQYKQNFKAYEEGALVWLFTPTDSSKDKVDCRKLANYWTGPWKIDSKPNEVTAKLIQVTPSGDKVMPENKAEASIDRLELFLKNSPNQPMLPELILRAYMPGDEFAEHIDSDLRAPSPLINSEATAPIPTIPSHGGTHENTQSATNEQNVRPMAATESFPIPQTRANVPQRGVKRDRSISPPPPPVPQTADGPFEPRLTSSPTPVQPTAPKEKRQCKTRPQASQNGPPPLDQSRTSRYNLRNRDQAIPLPGSQLQQREYDDILGTESDSEDSTISGIAEDDTPPASDQEEERDMSRDSDDLPE